MKKIPLSQGKFAIVDDEDYDYVMQWKWHCSARGYAVRNGPRPRQGLILMHRVILERKGFKDFAECDHVNHDRLDNSRSNLRPATHCQNQRNKSKLRNNTSGRIGVGWHSQAEKWRAYIDVNGKFKHLGLFDDIGEAVQARDKAAKKYYGEFANLNMKE
jgi:hypothetical protein